RGGCAPRQPLARARFRDAERHPRQRRAHRKRHFPGRWPGNRHRGRYPAILAGAAENGAAAGSDGDVGDLDLLHLFDPKAATLHADELSALCRFMSLSVEENDAQALIARALQIIHSQTRATAVGFLSFDPEEPLTKMVVPETHRVNLRLSRHLTQKAQAEGKSVWLQSGPRPDQPTSESLLGFTDGMGFPLRSEIGVS